MLGPISFRANRRALDSVARSAISCILICCLLALNFAARANADDHSAPLPHPSTQLRFDSQNIPSIATQPATSPRWTLLPEPSWLTPLPPATAKFLPAGRVDQLERLANDPLAGSSLPFASPRFSGPLSAAREMKPPAEPPSSSGSGRGRWLALGIAGLVVAGAGAVAYAGERSVCSSGTNSSGCNEVKTAGLVLMPVGAIMAVVGFVKYSRH